MFILTLFFDQIQNCCGNMSGINIHPKEVFCEVKDIQHHIIIYQII